MTVKHVYVWEALPQMVSEEAARVPTSVRIRAGTRTQALLGNRGGRFRAPPSPQVLSSSILSSNLGSGG